MKARLIGLISFFIMVAPTTQAHVRWFIEGKVIPDASFTLDGINTLTVFGAFALITVCGALQYLVNGSHTRNYPAKINTLITLLHKPIHPPFKLDWFILVLFLNLMLIVNLLLGDFLAPNLKLLPQVVMLGIIIQMIAILASIISISLTGVALIIVALWLPMVFPSAMALDYFFEVIGVGIAYVFIAPSINQNDNNFYGYLGISEEVDTKKLRQWGVTILRIALGLQLMTLALHNKLLEPGAALIFIQEFPFYNFMQQLGFEEYSHLHFVFAGGVFEFTFGLILMLGLAPRLMSLLLACIFATTTILSGIHEVPGHLPIFAVLLILFCAGDPRKSQYSKQDTREQPLSGALG